MGGNPHTDEHALGSVEESERKRKIHSVFLGTESITLSCQPFSSLLIILFTNPFTEKNSYYIFWETKAMQMICP